MRVKFTREDSNYGKLEWTDTWRFATATQMHQKSDFLTISTKVLKESEKNYKEDAAERKCGRKAEVPPPTFPPTPSGHSA